MTWLDGKAHLLKQAYLLPLPRFMPKHSLARKSQGTVSTCWIIWCSRNWVSRLWVTSSPYSNWPKNPWYHQLVTWSCQLQNFLNSAQKWRHNNPGNSTILFIAPCQSSVVYCTCTWMLFTRIELHIEMNLTWAWGREDYMRIRGFHDAQVDESIAWAMIGCQPKSGYASVHIYCPRIDIAGSVLSYSPLYFCLSVGR